jgi:hypothetical protein
MEEQPEYIHLDPCPFCGKAVIMQRSTKKYGGAYGYAFCHPGPPTTCVIRCGIVFVNFREASEWAKRWNTRA